MPSVPAPVIAMPVPPAGSQQFDTPTDQLPPASAAPLHPVSPPVPLAVSAAHGLLNTTAVPQQAVSVDVADAPMAGIQPSTTDAHATGPFQLATIVQCNVTQLPAEPESFISASPVQVQAVQAESLGANMLEQGVHNLQQLGTEAAQHGTVQTGMVDPPSLPNVGQDIGLKAFANPDVSSSQQRTVDQGRHAGLGYNIHPHHLQQTDDTAMNQAAPLISNADQAAAQADQPAATVSQEAAVGTDTNMIMPDSETAGAADRAAFAICDSTADVDQPQDLPQAEQLAADPHQPEQSTAADTGAATAATASEVATGNPAVVATPAAAAHQAVVANPAATAGQAAAANPAAETEQARPVSPGNRAHGSKSAADVFDRTVRDCNKLISQTRSVLLKEPTSSSEAPSSRIAAAERATSWHKELEGLGKQCKQPQLYIGVLGDTGTFCCACMTQ